MWTQRRLLVLIIALVALTPSVWASDVKDPLYKAPSSEVHRARSFHALADIAETEPNDRFDQAQFIGCGNSLRPASLTNVAAVPDTDWISFSVSAGDLITFETALDDLEPETDTIIQLIASDGTTVLASNDDAPNTLFSRITDFEAPYTGLYYGRIRGFSGATGPYRANVSCVPPPPPPDNDQCAGAVLIKNGFIELSGTTRFATNDYDLCPGSPVCASSCTGFHSPGKDVVFKIDIGSAGEVIDVSYVVSPPLVDASIYLVTDCSDVQGSCVVGQDTEIGVPTEHLSHVFSSAGEYFLILDGFTGDGGDWSLSGCLNCATPTRPHSWGELKVLYRSR